MNTETERSTELVNAAPSKTTRACVCLCVRGAIKSLQSSRRKNSDFQHSDGRPMTKNDGINALMDELVKGHETIPMNKKCGKPCQNSPLCAGFDFGVNGGCPGYVVETPAEVSESPK
jgi:hypothetical protein